jgi:hypothetical protein
MNEESKLPDDKAAYPAGRDEEEGDPCEIPNFLLTKYKGNYGLYFPQ